MLSSWRQDAIKAGRRLTLRQFAREENTEPQVPNIRLYFYF